MREQVGLPQKHKARQIPVCPYIPTSKQQQDCHKELIRIVIDAELPFKTLDNLGRASKRCCTFKKRHGILQKRLIALKKYWCVCMYVCVRVCVCVCVCGVSVYSSVFVCVHVSV